MKPTITAAMAALLALTACGGEGSGEANDSSANQANAAEAAPAVDNDAAAANATDEDAAPQAAQVGEGGPRATAASPSSEIRALLIGRWTDNGNCAAATEFRSDGTFTSPAGTGRWTLESEYLTLSGAGPDAELAVQVIDRREMDTVSPMGRIGRWTRC